MKRFVSEVQKELSRTLIEHRTLPGFQAFEDLNFRRRRGDFVDILMVYVEWTGEFNAVRAGASMWCGSESLRRFIENSGLPESYTTYWNDRGNLSPLHITFNLARNEPSPPMFAPWIMATNVAIPDSQTLASRVFNTPESLAASMCREVERMHGWWNAMNSGAALYERISTKAADQGGYSDDLFLHALTASWIGDRTAVESAALRYERLQKDTEELQHRSHRYGRQLQMIDAVLRMLRGAAPPA